MTSPDVESAATTDETLRENLARLTALIESVQMGVLLEDDARHITHANTQFCALFGIPGPEFLIGADCSQSAEQSKHLFADPEAFVEQITARLAAGQTIIGDELRLADGRVFERDYVPVRVGDAGHGHMWLYRDVTDRKSAEQALRESEARYRAIVEDQTEFVDRWQPDGTVTFVNEAYCRSAHKTRQQVLNHTFFDTIHPDDRARVLALLAELNPDHPVQTIEHRSAAPDGGVRWQQWINRAFFDDAGQLVEVQSTGRDVTERRRTQEELERSLSVLRAIIESSLDGIIVLDRDADLLIYNQRFAQMWNLPAGWEHDMSRDEQRDLAARQTTDPAGFIHIADLSAANPETEFHETVIALDGRTIAVSITPFRMAGEIAGRVFSFRDTTDQSRKQEVGLQAQKLEAVGLLAGGIAHDFNNALTIILGNVMLARQTLPADNEAQERLGAAEVACLRARALTQQLLTFSRGGAPIKRALALAPLLTDIVSFALRGSNIACDCRLAPDLWSVDADEGQLRQVMLNLLVNAKEAMPDGGSIQLSAENVVSAGAEPGRSIRITVRDFGEGIPIENLPKIFDPYFTTKPKGRGMGLAAAYSIVRDHGGHIVAESQVGRGTTVTVRLPASTRALATPAPAPPRDLRRGLRILIMDDEDLVRDVAGRMLGRAGYQVAFAHDGAEALAAYRQAREESRPFDIVIMDLTIPGGMGGKEAVGQLLAIDPGARVIVSSGYSNDPIMADHERHGFCGVVAKPYQPEELYRAINACLDGVQDL